MRLPINFPPIRQSTLESAQCLFRFQQLHVNGKKEPTSEFADRGVQFHKLHKLYIDHLVASQQEYDWDAAKALARACPSDEARRLFDNWYPKQIIPYGNVFGTEVRIRLDAEFHNCAEGYAFSGDLDRLELDGTKAIIPDIKTNWAIFEPDTIQAHFYPWLVWRAMPFVSEVTFRLEFVRYNRTKEVSFTADEIADFEKTYIVRLVDRILEAWDLGEWPAKPCKQCSFCSLDCPLVRSGISRESIGQIGTQERAVMLAGELYVMETRAARAKAALKAFCTEAGPIAMDNGEVLGFQKRTTQEYDVQLARALNEEHGFDKNRCLSVDNAEVKRVAKKYPEFKARLAQTAKDRSTTQFGFRKDTEEKEEE